MNIKVILRETEFLKISEYVLYITTGLFIFYLTFMSIINDSNINDYIFGNIQNNVIFIISMLNIISAVLCRAIRNDNKKYNRKITIILLMSSQFLVGNIIAVAVLFLSLCQEKEMYKYNNVNRNITSVTIFSVITFLLYSIQFILYRKL